MSWQESALCAETDINAFYPETGDTAAVRRAKKICGMCSVKTPCLRYALTNEIEYGIWGGLTPKQRAALKRGAA